MTYVDTCLHSFGGKQYQIGVPRIYQSKWSSLLVLRHGIRCRYLDSASCLLRFHYFVCDTIERWRTTWRTWFYGRDGAWRQRHFYRNLGLNSWRTYFGLLGFIWDCWEDVFRVLSVSREKFLICLFGNLLFIWKRRCNSFNFFQLVHYNMKAGFFKNKCSSFSFSHMITVSSSLLTQVLLIQRLLTRISG